MNKLQKQETGLTKKIDLDQFKSIYYLLNAKPDSQIRLLKENKKLNFEDLLELNASVISKLKTESLETSITTITVVFKNKKVNTYNNWLEFERTNWQISDQTLSISINWDINIKLPEHELPQRHTLKVRLGSPIRPNEIFQLMMTSDKDDELMEKVELIKLTNNLDNKRIPLNSIQRSKKESKPLYPYIGANNIMGYIDEYIFDEKILCIAEDGGSWGFNQTCAKIYNEKCWVNNHAHVVTAKENVILEYLMYYLNFSDLTLYINGATRGKLTKTSLNSIKIPLPNLETQKKIAAILDEADKLRQLNKQLIAKYDALTQSLFLDMFGDPVNNTKGFNTSTIGEQCIVKGGKRVPKGEKLVKENTGYPYKQLLDLRLFGHLS